MILLALIPAAALLIIVVLCLRAKQAYNFSCTTVAEKAEQLRQEKLELDQQNDADLIKKVVAGKQPLAELLSKSQEERKSILPEARRSDPENWTNDDLQQYLKRWAFNLNLDNRRGILFTCAFTFLGVIAVSAALAAWRYSSISYHPSTQSAPSGLSSGSDPFASFAPASSGASANK